MRANTWTENQYGGMVGGNANLDFFYDPWFVDVDLTKPDKVVDTDYGYTDIMKSIPGAGKAFRNRRTAKFLRVSWSVTAIMDGSWGYDYDNDGDNVADGSDSSPYEVGYRLALFLNGYRIDDTDYRFKMGSSSMVMSRPSGPGAPTSAAEHYNTVRPDIRVYSGYFIIDGNLIGRYFDDSTYPAADSPLLLGRHTADIRVVCRGGTTPVKDGWWFFGTSSELPWGQVRIKSRRINVVPYY